MLQDLWLPEEELHHGYGNPTYSLPCPIMGIIFYKGVNKSLSYLRPFTDTTVNEFEFLCFLQWDSG